MTLVPETGEVLSECPYNKSHLVSQARMQFHLVKCRKASGEETKTCPFNGQHHVRCLEYQNHVANCPDRSTVVNFIHKASNEASAVAPYVAPILPKEEENWDEAGEVPTYDPSERCASVLVLRTLTGATRSQRKSFRKDERDRYQMISNGPPPSAPVGIPEEVVESEEFLKVVKKDCFETSKSLRKPKARSETFVLPPEILNKVGQGRGKPLVQAAATNDYVNQGVAPSQYVQPPENATASVEKVKKTKKKGKTIEIRPVTSPAAPAAKPWSSSVVIPSDPRAISPAAALTAALAPRADRPPPSDDIWTGLPLKPIGFEEDKGPIPHPDFNLNFPSLTPGRGRGRNMNNVQQNGKKDKH